MNAGRRSCRLASAVLLAAVLSASLLDVARASGIPSSRSPSAGPPRTVGQLLHLPGAFLVDVDFSSARSAVAEWSNCSSTDSSSNCRWAYTTTDDGWRTSHALPFLDRLGGDGSNDRWVLSLPHGAVLSTINFVDDHVVEGGDRVYPVTVSHKPLRAVDGRTVVGLLPDFTTTPMRSYYTLYDPHTRSLHPVSSGRAVLDTMTTSSTGSLLYAERERSRGPCLISASTNGGGTWVDHGKIACRNAFAINQESAVLSVGARLVVFSPADPRGRVPYTHGHFWMSARSPSGGDVTVRSNTWKGPAHFGFGRVGDHAVVVVYGRYGDPLGWRTINGTTGALGPVHHDGYPRGGLRTDERGDIGWDTTPHRLQVYFDLAQRPETVNPR